MNRPVQITFRKTYFLNPALRSTRFIFIFIFLTALYAVSNAQETTQENVSPANIIKDIVPPPLEIISKGETDQLLSQRSDSKKRVETALFLMENRLKKAETFSNEKKFQETIDELGGFQALMRDAMTYLQKSGGENKKNLGNYKRFEINLRNFVPRLELVRRILPEKFSYHVVQLMKFVRKTRASAIEPMFSTTVVNEN